MRTVCHQSVGRIIGGLALAFLLLALVGCQGMPREGGPAAREFRWRDLAKSDIDLVAEVTLRQHRAYLRELADKLYRRNPTQLRRGVGDREEALRQILGRPGRGMLAQWRERRGARLVELALSKGFEGDRVAAFVYGLRSMAVAAYGSEDEFFLSDEYDPQKIYHLARNLEIAAWRLRAARDASGRALLLSVGIDAGGEVNASYERLFGKLIALHDHFAQVVADSTHRRIKNVIQGVASAVFFPL